MTFIIKKKPVLSLHNVARRQFPLTRFRLFFTSEHLRGSPAGLDEPQLRHGRHGIGPGLRLERDNMSLSVTLQRNVTSCMTVRRNMACVCDVVTSCDVK